jgi:hypothetical protein
VGAEIFVLHLGMVAFHQSLNGISARILLVNLAPAVETGVAGRRSAQVAGFGLGILAMCTSSTALGRADVFLSLCLLKRWRRGHRMVVISHFQQERLWERGGDVIEKALVRWCVDWVKNEGIGAADVLISWMDGDCAWREIGTCMADPWRRQHDPTMFGHARSLQTDFEMSRFF